MNFKESVGKYFRDDAMFPDPVCFYISDYDQDEEKVHYITIEEGEQIKDWWPTEAVEGDWHLTTEITEAEYKKWAVKEMLSSN